MIIIGAGINHWYHANLMYRAGAMALMLCGCVGKNGGGLNHYVGQEKLAPMDSWSAHRVRSGLARRRCPPAAGTACGTTSTPASTGTTGYYSRYNTVPEERADPTGTPPIRSSKSVRMGCMPFYPQFKQNTLELCKEAQRGNGAVDDAGIQKHVLEKLKSEAARVTPSSDPEAEENFPRVWYIWRGNAIMGSRKGHEYCPQALPGDALQRSSAEDSDDHVQRGRSMARGRARSARWTWSSTSTSAWTRRRLYSDIVLPAASSWYEKADLNSTDPSLLHPSRCRRRWHQCGSRRPTGTSSATSPRRRARSAKKYLPEPQKDIIAGSDRPRHGLVRSRSRSIKDWYQG